MTRYLRQYRRDIRMKHEIGVFDKKPSDATEVDRTEKIVEVDVEDVTPFLVLDRIGDDRTVTLETVR
jgi:hypothetical protein